MTLFFNTNLNPSYVVFWTFYYFYEFFFCTSPNFPGIRYLPPYFKMQSGKYCTSEKSGHNSAPSFLISSVDWPIRHGNCLIINLVSVSLILPIDVIEVSCNVSVRMILEHTNVYSILFTISDFRKKDQK